MRVTYDVVVVGGSFGGLAAASQLRGSILIIDREPVGSGQRSACGTPLRVPMALGLGDSVLQVHERALFHLGSHSFELPGTEPFCTFDYEGFCQGLYALTSAEFVQASVRGVRAEGSERLIVSTSAGEFTARYVVDASGWSAVAASSLDSRVQPREGVGFGLETTVLHQGEGLRIWLDRGLHPGRLGWLFPSGDHSRAGLASYTGDGVKGQRVAEFALSFGPAAPSLHGGFFPLRLRRPVVGPLFVVGDSAGHCMPLTAEGIRPAIYFGQQCGALLQLVLDEKLALAQAQSTYRQLHDSCRPYYRWLLQHQNWTTRLPGALLAAVMKVAKMTGQSERILRRYCAMMPITPAYETECDVGDGRRLAPAGIPHGLR
ncbi:MAG: hypothetical protein IH957_11190 [Chloroflexi bacterium]|nr:hypothetical protein [Chloroflexota bacterium]